MNTPVAGTPARSGNLGAKLWRLGCCNDRCARKCQTPREPSSWSRAGRSKPARFESSFSESQSARHHLKDERVLHGAPDEFCARTDGVDPDFLSRMSLRGDLHRRFLEVGFVRGAVRYDPVATWEWIDIRIDSGGASVARSVSIDKSCIRDPIRVDRRCHNSGRTIDVVDDVQNSVAGEAGESWGCSRRSGRAARLAGRSG